MAFKKFVTTGKFTIGAGMIVLTKKQGVARTYSGSVKKVDTFDKEHDVYEVLRPIEFKAGEEIMLVEGTIGARGKSVLEDLEPEKPKLTEEVMKAAAALAGKGKKKKDADLPPDEKGEKKILDVTA